MNNQPLFRPIDSGSRNLTESAFEAIREAIVRKDLAPGAPLSERKLSAQLEVSKTPVREALLRLQHLGLVEVTGRSMRVTPSSPERLSHAYQVRAGMESTAARLAALQGTPDQLAWITSTNQQVANASRSDRASNEPFPGFYTPERKHHLRIAEASQNPLLARLVDESFTMCWVLRQRDASDIGRQEEFALSHSEIVEAITARDEKKAAESMYAHIDAVRGGSSPRSSEGLRHRAQVPWHKGPTEVPLGPLDHA